MEKVALVSDSSCDICEDQMRELGIHCVNMSITGPDGQPFPSNNTEKNIEAFYDMMDSNEELPKTSMPSVAQFESLYAQLAEEGYTHIISAHIPLAMSGTVNAATMAAESCPIPVSVIDTERNTWSLGLIMRRLSLMRAAGASFEVLENSARNLWKVSDVCFAIDSLKNLVKGGRTGKATGLVADLLKIKPVLTVGDDGEVVSLGMARSMKNAMKKLTEKALALADEIGPLEGYFLHVRNLEAVEMLRDMFNKAGVPYTDLGTRQAGPVIATHVGTGTTGFTYIAKEQF